MIGTTVTIRYARALYDVAVEKGIIEKVTKDLGQIDFIMNQSNEIRDYCRERHADRIQEINFLNIAFIPYVSDLTGTVLKIAVRNGRLTILPYLRMAFNEIKNKEEGITEVILESAQPADDSIRNTIMLKMNKRIGEKIKVVPKVVPELLGGIRILWNSRMIDLSAAGRFKKIRSIIKTDL